jgi:hypothetical protein
MVRETQVNGYTITLERRDQYNDYSVAYDYRVTVCEGNCQYGKAWELGSGVSLANAAFELCRSWACRQARQRAA